MNYQGFIQQCRKSETLLTRFISIKTSFIEMRYTLSILGSHWYFFEKLVKAVEPVQFNFNVEFSSSMF